MFSLLLTASLQAPTTATISPPINKLWMELIFEAAKFMMTNGPWFKQMPLPQPAKPEPPSPITQICGPQTPPSNSQSSGNTTNTACIRTAASLLQEFAQKKSLPTHTTITIQSRQWQPSVCYGIKPLKANYNCLKLVATESRQAQNFVGCVFTHPDRTNARQLPGNDQPLIVSGDITDYRSQPNLVWLSNCQVLSQRH